MEKKRWRGCCERVGGREGIVIRCRFCGGSKDFVTFRMADNSANKKPKTSSQGEAKNRGSFNYY